MANFLHYAIQKLHWSPSEIKEWFDSDINVKAFYFGSSNIRMESGIFPIPLVNIQEQMNAAIENMDVSAANNAYIAG